MFFLWWLLVINIQFYLPESVAYLEQSAEMDEEESAMVQNMWVKLVRSDIPSKRFAGGVEKEMVLVVLEAESSDYKVAAQIVRAVVRWECFLEVEKRSH